MKKKDEPFKGLAGILDIIYGALFSFVIYTIGEKYFSLPEGSSFISIKLLALALIGIFMLEDYCNVKLVNSVKGYGSTDRFSLDVMIAFLFFFAFQAVNKFRNFHCHRDGVIIVADQEESDCLKEAKNDIYDG